MKRIICVLLACIFLTSCAYNKNTILKGDKVKFEVKVPGMPAPIKGEGTLMLIRQVNLLPCWMELPEFYNAEIAQGEDKIEVKK